MVSPAFTKSKNLISRFEINFLQPPILTSLVTFLRVFMKHDNQQYTPAVVFTLTSFHFHMQDHSIIHITKTETYNHEP